MTKRETKEELERSKRIIIREFLKDVASNLGDYDSGISYPGVSAQVDEKDWDGSVDSVRFFMVTATDFKDWLKEIAPPRGHIHISPKGVSYPNATGWYAECDDCGMIAEGDMSPEGHDLVVRSWYAHDKEKHKGDGVIPYSSLILKEGS